VRRSSARSKRPAPVLLQTAGSNNCCRLLRSASLPESIGQPCLASAVQLSTERREISDICRVQSSKEPAGVSPEAIHGRAVLPSAMAWKRLF
jgi:hypothetical protein